MGSAPFTNTPAKNKPDLRELWWIIALVLVFGLIFGWVYYNLGYDVDSDLMKVVGCQQTFDYVNSHDESTQSIQTVRVAMKLLYSCVSSQLENDQSIKVIKDTRTPNPDTGIDADVRVEYTTKT